MKQKQYIPISWQKLEKDTISLAKKILGEYGRPDEIVTIAKGGIVAARILADILDIPISFITIESYQNLRQEKQPVITQASIRQFNKETILLLDELTDTGKTLQKAMEYLNNFPISSIMTASVYLKPHAQYVPDFWIQKLDGWVIFPYELRETKAAFIKQYGFEEAKKKLQEVHIQDWTNLEK